MAEKTKNLKLNKPNTGSQNWGIALNSNMEILDKAYNSLISRIESLLAQLNAMNYLSFEEDNSYVKLNTDGVDFDHYFTTGNYEDDAGGFIGNKKYYSTDFPSSDGFLYSDIIDYTGYYVVNSIIGNADLLAPYNEDWDAGEIMVKISYIEDNERKIKFLHFPQALGGYYIPTQETIGSTTIKWIKKMPLEAGEYYNTSFPSNIIKAKYNSVPFSSFTKINETEYKYVLYDIEPLKHLPPNLEISFFILENNEYNQFYIDYYLSLDESNRTVIRIKFSLPQTNLNKFIMKYVIYQEE